MANRHQARESALEILYAWHSAGQDGGMLPQQLSDRMSHAGRKDQDKEYLREIVYGVSENVEALDELLRSVVRGRSLRSIGHIEHNILRIAAWEMQNRLEIPYRVIINEALELSRAYASEAARGFINGVLDNLARRLRPEEARQQRTSQR